MKKILLSKRVLAMVLTLVLIASVCPSFSIAASYGDLILSMTSTVEGVETDNFETGDEVVVTLNIASPAIAAILITVNYPQNLLELSELEAEIEYTSGGKTRYWEGIKNTETSGTIIGNWGNATNLNVGGHVMTMTFTAKGSGSSSITAVADPNNVSVAETSDRPTITNATLNFTVTDGSTEPAEKTLTSIAVTNQPNIAYVVGQKFSTDGMQITAYYSDGTSAPVSGWTCDTADGSELTSAGQSTATISYAEGSVTKTTQFTYHVAEVGSYQVTLNPSRTSLDAGETFTVNLDVNGNAGFASFYSNVSYDQNELELKSVTASSAIGGESAINKETAGQVKFAHVGDTNSTTESGATVATLTFTVTTSIADTDTTSISLSGIKVGQAGTEDGGNQTNSANDAVLNLYNLTAKFKAGTNITLDSGDVTYYLKHNEAGLYSDVARTNAVAAPTASVESGKTGTHDFLGWYDSENKQVTTNTQITVGAYTESQEFEARAREKDKIALTWSNDITITAPNGLTGGSADIESDTVITFTVGSPPANKRLVSAGYTVDGGDYEAVTPVGEVYTINIGDFEAAPDKIHIEAKWENDLTVEIVTPDSQTTGAANGQKLIKVTLTKLESGTTLKYDGNGLFWSSRHSAYLYYVDDTADEASIKEKLTFDATMGATNAELTYDGDVNQNGTTDVYDAQVSWDLYKNHENYRSSSALSMRKRLEADFAAGTPDHVVDTQDAAAIIATVVGNS